ncbi:sensor histidine kinase [Streptomyces boninensis]|uniref:sensor histidine kinase n=1 Tax=Streptomyces boninensis TaxID=2039455 RepID=UPI003B210BCE
MKRLRGAHLYALDAAVAVLVTAVYVGFVREADSLGEPAFHGPFWLGLLIAVAAGVPLAVRRRLPVPAFGLVVAALTAASLLDLTREVWLPAAAAAYAVGLCEPIRRAVAVLAAGLVVAGVSVLLSEAVVTPSGGWAEAAGVALLVLLCSGTGGAAGCVVRNRRAEVVARERRRAGQAVAEERLRIARELHDIVSHNLSLIAVKAGVAAHVAEADPREAQSALKVIEETSRSALAEMRRTLGVLRTPADLPLGPAPGLGDLQDLAAQAEAAGVAVDLAVQDAEGLAEGQELTVYRIVQEAVTNAVKHAAPTRCAVRVAATAGEVRIEVADEGRTEEDPVPAPASAGELTGGHGLLGMRERVMMYGGSFAAGPRDEGGFTVSVRLPREEGGGR